MNNKKTIITSLLMALVLYSAVPLNAKKRTTFRGVATIGVGVAAVAAVTLIGKHLLDVRRQNYADRRDLLNIIERWTAEREDRTLAVRDEARVDGRQNYWCNWRNANWPHANDMRRRYQDIKEHLINDINAGNISIAWSNADVIPAYRLSSADIGDTVNDIMISLAAEKAQLIADLATIDTMTRESIEVQSIFGDSVDINAGVAYYFDLACKGQNGVYRQLGQVDLFNADTRARIVAWVNDYCRKDGSSMKVYNHNVAIAKYIELAWRYGRLCQLEEIVPTLLTGVALRPRPGVDMFGIDTLNAVITNINQMARDAALISSANIDALARALTSLRAPMGQRQPGAVVVLGDVIRRLNVVARNLRGQGVQPELMAISDQLTLLRDGFPRR